MDVIEEQLGFPARKGGLILLATEIEFLLIEDILKYEGTLYGNMKRWEGGIVKRKRQYWKAITATLTVDF